MNLTTAQMKKIFIWWKNSKILLGIMLYSVMKIYFMILEIKEVYKSLKQEKKNIK